MKMFNCDCHGEGIVLDTCRDDGEVILSIWTLGAYDNNLLSFKERIRYCWRILTKGKPYGDQIILNKEMAIDFANEITKLANDL